jgi:methyl-accepting chemotaxis protein
MNMRRILIVDKKFQYAFILRNLALLLIAFVMIFAFIKIWEKRQTEQGFLLRPPPNYEMIAWAQQNNIEIGSAAFLQGFIEKARVYTFFGLLWQPLAAILIINVIILVIANIYHSHRIAGPIHRLKKVLEQKLNGENVAPVRFRENDSFQELADVVNKLIASNEPKK